MASNGWGDYEVNFDQVLGRGGMGTVYKGRQISVDRTVAIKVLKRDLTESPDFVRRFYREATLLAKLVDSRIVQVFGAGEAEGQHWYAMEFVEGEDLSTRIRRGYQFTHEEIVRIALETAEALASAWKEKIIHRDIKPSNIIMTKDNHVKVMDFGLAKNPENDLTQTEMIMGTAKYMSPEQATGGQCDIRSDLYSLGAVLYELATGTAPFVGESATAVIYQHVHKVPVAPEKLNPTLPPTMSQVVMRLLAKDPKDRYSTPEELIRDCRAILEGVSLDEKTVLYHEVGKSPTGETAAVSKNVNVTGTIQVAEGEAESRTGMYVGLAAAVLILAAGGYFVFGALRKGPGPAPAPVKPDGNGTRPDPNGGRNPVEKPEWEKQVERLLQEGGGAAGRKDWMASVSSFGQALELLRKNKPDDPRIPETERKLRNSQYWQAIEAAGKTERNAEKIALYHKARELAVTESDRTWAETLLRAVKSEEAEREGRERLAKQDWSGAAQAFKEAAADADLKERIQKLEKLRDFALAMVEVDEFRRARKWDELQAKVEKLLAGEKFEFGPLLEKILEDARTEIRKRDEARYRELVHEAREHYIACRWDEAGKRLDEADQEKYRAFQDDEFRSLRRRIRRALKPPEGMVYLPAGKYPVGVTGDKPEFGPETQIEIGEVYVDLAPATAGEYKLFLDALGTSGHDSNWCHPDETRAKKTTHLPRKFAQQKPEAAVVDVDWFDAYAFAAWKGKRLPTEFEFEIAASYDVREKRRRIYPWGNAFPGEGPSPFGLSGLDDDIPEWTSSQYLSYATKVELKPNAWVLRGGYKVSKETELRTFHRTYDYRDRAGRFGIRCARSIRDDE